MPHQLRVSIQNAEEIENIDNEVEVVFQSGPSLRPYDPRRNQSGMRRLIEEIEGNFGLEAVTKRPLIDVTPDRIAIIEKVKLENETVMRVDGHLLDSESTVFKDIEELIKSGFPHAFEAAEIEHLDQIQIEIQHKRWGSFVRAVRLWGFDEMEGRKIASFKNPTI